MPWLNFAVILPDECSKEFFIRLMFLQANRRKEKGNLADAIANI